MAFLISHSNDILRNLAIEEYLLRRKDIQEDILFLWYGSKAFVYGRNQNPFIEIHPDYILDDSIIKVRRISGGGTIYQDQGTLNFSIITNDFKNRINNYEYFLESIKNILKSQGLNVHFKPKSHLFVDDYKISGNAQAFINNKLLHHGTILYDTDLDIIQKALIHFQANAQGHQVLSNKQAVINLKDMIGLSKEELMNQISYQMIHDYHINESEIEIEEEKIQEIIKNKYQTWEWNYGKTPTFTIKEAIDDSVCDITIEKGYIVKISPLVDDRLLNTKYFNQDYIKHIKRT
ncbi:lipoate--protein ligase family protein [Hujiaoplasma nucleasis]|uniref:Lipoate--protein ligase family protein n=1 Tax=Hujiaoplasma nucleasis TaxID=2725268 RepID=A0A7L6N4P8_9MOLU|nr:lipoate--protein ligase family protein [Hujiaoplasma nucleasis]QLY40218.1 lipoate--protein ligase family protein [Hujiaoplasma nucleasis]